MSERVCVSCRFGRENVRDYPCNCCFEVSGRPKWEARYIGSRVAIKQEEPEICPDMCVEQPKPNNHYQTDIQPLEVMQANMTPEEFIGFLKGNIIKYTCRDGKKDASMKEALKIADYSRWLVLARQGKKIDPRKD